MTEAKQVRPAVSYLATPALALTAVALRARASLEDSDAR